MAGNRLLLTINKDLYEILKKKASSKYMSIQELINDLLRKEILVKKRAK